MSTVHPVLDSIRLESVLPRKVTFTDEFMSNSTETGEVGRVGWSFGGGGVITSVNSTASHPGVISVQASGAAGNNVRLHITSANNITAIASADIAYVGWLVYFPAITGFNTKIGVSDQIIHAWGTEGAWFSFDSGVSAGKWEVNTKTGAGTETTTSSTTVAVTTWYFLEMIRDPSNGRWTFLINGVPVATHAVRIPTAQMNIGISINNNDGLSVKDCYLDYFVLESNSLGNRY
jgi:hypothetical protein